MEIKDNTSFTELNKIDIRLGKVIAAEIPAKGKKFIQLSVNFGGENNVRTIVTNLGAPKYTPEDYIGKLIPFILNLGLKHIAGIESQGMILASNNPETQEATMISLEQGNPGDILL